LTVGKNRSNFFGNLIRKFIKSGDYKGVSEKPQENNFPNEKPEWTIGKYLNWKFVDVCC
jgi:hypothetical protein